MAYAAQEFGLLNITAIQVGTAPADFQHGANFAIISATANNGSFFAGKGMTINPFSLDTQMLWFRAHVQQLTQQNRKCRSTSDHCMPSTNERRPDQ